MEACIFTIFHELLMKYIKKNFDLGINMIRSKKEVLEGLQRKNKKCLEIVVHKSENYFAGSVLNFAILNDLGVNMTSLQEGSLL